MKTLSADACFNKFVASYGGELKKLAYLTLGDLTAAEDVTQVALLKVLKHWSDISHPRAYARRAVTTACIDWQRKASRERLASNKQAPTEPSTTGPTGTEQWTLREALWQAVKALPVRQRSVLALRYFEELDDAEIAQILGIRESTVRSTTARALAALRNAHAEELQ